MPWKECCTLPAWPTGTRPGKHNTDLQVPRLPTLHPNPLANTEPSRRAHWGGHCWQHPETAASQQRETVRPQIGKGRVRRMRKLKKAIMGQTGYFLWSPEPAISMFGFWMVRPARSSYLTRLWKFRSRTSECLPGGLYRQEIRSFDFQKNGSTIECASCAPDSARPASTPSTASPAPHPLAGISAAGTIAAAFSATTSPGLPPPPPLLPWCCPLCRSASLRRLHGDVAFQQASYGLIVFAIPGARARVRPGSPGALRFASSRPASDGAFLHAKPRLLLFVVAVDPVREDPGCEDEGGAVAKDAASSAMRSGRRACSGRVCRLRPATAAAGTAGHQLRQHPRCRRATACAWRRFADGVVSIEAWDTGGAMSVAVVSTRPSFRPHLSGPNAPSGSLASQETMRLWGMDN
ncbi:hypothetical protein MAPG_11377 [Magnaporthiopsis poae ATCC 64411]|uniref:Uncharacterized protein n=1 Tax=Magnaporthiopsis poae (strain ATCC 64411 / 73-15) TaxID=644358 RepID=A0A0C4EF41_MAGP6|nr:hypothetical protein MAPG_11377 [Magnaporthiopsis poae ATCC 64411]